MNSGRIPSYIQLREGVYYVRISVPPALRIYIGKNELKRSLNTRSTSEAARLAPATIAHFQRQIEAARQKCTPVHTMVSHVQFDQVRKVAAARLDRMQTLPDRSRAQGRQFLEAGAGKARAHRLAENRALVEFYQEVAEGDHWDSWRIALGRSTVAAYEEQYAVRVAPSSPAHAILSELGAQVEIEHARRAIHRDEAFYATAPAPGSTDLFTRPSQQTSLGELLTIFRRDKEGRWKPASARATLVEGYDVGDVPQGHENRKPGPRGGCGRRATGSSRQIYDRRAGIAGGGAKPHIAKTDFAGTGVAAVFGDLEEAALGLNLLSLTAFKCEGLFKVQEAGSAARRTAGGQGETGSGD